MRHSGYNFKDRRVAERLKNMLTDALPLRPNMSRRDQFRQSRPVVFTATGGTVPAWGIVEITGGSALAYTSDSKIPVHAARQPGTSAGSLYLLNRGLDVPDGTRGSAQTGDIMIAKYDALPTQFGQPVGPAADTYAMSATQFVVSTHRFLFDFDPTAKLMVVATPHHSDVFRVVMERTGGSNGTDTTMNTYVYDVFDDSGEMLLASGVTVPYVATTHDYATQELGEVDPATAGLAYYRSGQLIIHHCNEQYRVGPCDSGVAAGFIVESGASIYDVEESNGVLTIATRDAADRDTVAATITVAGTVVFDGWFAAPARMMRVPNGTITATLELYDATGQRKPNTRAVYTNT